MYERLKLLPLTANKEMANEIADALNVDVMPATVTKFADGELCFEGGESCRGNNIYIIQSTCTPVSDRLMEVLLAIDACKRASARTITCVIPYFGYSRQDRKAKPRQPISARLVADLLTVAGADRVVCTDLHASQIQGFFDIPVDDVSAMPIFYRYFKKANLENICCVSPDHGGVVRTSKLAERLNAPIAIIDKRRPRPNQAEFVGIVGDVKDKTCIIYDDIVDTAGTLCLAANKLKELGAKKVYAAITHGILSRDAVEKINNSALEKLIITDSIPLPEDKKSDKIEVIHLAPLLQEIIAALEDGRSLSEARAKFDNKMFRGK
ncbi:MAG: ribose-phosphate pyrophosphokinase [Bacilli bacterium]|nr:ribose-phosphate pyrophosphokinase [Bacilli bacterium]